MDFRDDVQVDPYLIDYIYTFYPNDIYEYFTKSMTHLIQYHGDLPLKYHDRMETLIHDAYLHFRDYLDKGLDIWEDAQSSHHPYHLFELVHQYTQNHAQPFLHQLHTLYERAARRTTPRVRRLPQLTTVSYAMWIYDKTADQLYQYGF